MSELNLELVMTKAEIKKESLKKEGGLHNREAYHNMKGEKLAEATRGLYLTALTNTLKEITEALRSGNGYKINDAEIKLRTIYDLTERVLELHGG